MYKVVLTDSSGFKNEQYLIERDIFKDKKIDFVIADCKTEEEIIQLCADADAVVTIFSKLNENVINHLKKCKVMVRYGIGYDTIDVDAATKKGIFVCNIPDYCVKEVATHAMALILALERKIVQFDRSVRQEQWSSFYGYETHSVNQHTLGLVGFGNVARQVAAYAKCFEFKIVAYDPYVKDELFEKSGVQRMSLDQLLGYSDIISIHVPLNQETHHLINKDAFAKMKRNAMLINTSRGPIVSQQDLVDALKNNRILAAGLDVLETEPLKDKNAAILQLENVIVTPHAAANTIESFQELHRKVAETVCSILNGDFSYNIVNKQLLNK